MKHQSLRSISIMVLILTVVMASFAGCTWLGSLFGDDVEVTYNVTYEGVEGATHENPATYTVATAAELAPASKEHYTFEGWYNGETKVETLVGLEGDLTLTAKWTAVEYSITYDLAGGTQASNPLTSYNVENRAEAALPAPTKAGYTFDGWYNGEAKVTSLADMAENVTLTAKWTAVEYTIEYDLDGGKQAENPITVYTVENSATLALPNPTKEGYAFDGWYVGETRLESLAGKAENLSLTAHWSKNAYSITYNGIEGATHSNPMSYDVDTTENITLADASKEHYIFGGWYAAADLSGDPITVIDTSKLQNVELWAKWTPVDYTITYDTNTGDALESGTYNVETRGTFVLPTPTKTGYTFEGWYAGETKVASIADKTGDLTLVAKWSLAQTLALTVQPTVTDGAVNDVEISSNGVEGTVSKVTYDGQDITDAYLAGTRSLAFASLSVEGKDMVIETSVATYTLTIKLEKIELGSNVTSIDDFVTIVNAKLDGHFVLTADLNFGENAPTTTVTATAWGSANKASIGTFSGTLDGQGHALTFKTSNATLYFVDVLTGTLENIYIDYTADFVLDNNRQGLIGKINGGTVENVLINCKILSGNASASTVNGVLCATRLGAVAYRIDSGSINNVVVVTRDVRADKAPTLNRELSGCLVGFQVGGTIENCYAIDAAGIGMAVGGTDNVELKGDTVGYYKDLSSALESVTFAADAGWTELWKIENDAIYFGDNAVSYKYLSGVTETVNSDGTTSYSLSANCDSVIWMAEGNFAVSGMAKIVGTANRNMGWCITDANGVQFHISLVNASVGLFNSSRGATTKLATSTWNLRTDEGAQYKLGYDADSKLFVIFMNGETAPCASFSEKEVNTFLGTTIDMSKSYIGVSMMNWSSAVTSVEMNNCSIDHDFSYNPFYLDGVTETKNEDGTTSYSLSANCDSAIWQAEDSFEVSGMAKIVGTANRNMGWCITDANGVQFHLCLVNASVGLFNSSREATSKEATSTWNLRSDEGAHYRLVYDDFEKAFYIFMNGETTACMTYTVDEVNTFLGTTIDMSTSYIGVSMMNWSSAVTSVEMNNCTFTDLEDWRYLNGVTRTVNEDGTTSYSLSANCASAIWQAEDSFEVSGMAKIVGTANRNMGWCITDANGVQFHLCLVNASVGLFNSSRAATTKEATSTWNLRSDEGAHYRLVYDDFEKAFYIFMNGETTACMTYTVDEVNTFLGTTIDMSKSYIGVSMMNWSSAVTSVEMNNCTFVDTAEETSDATTESAE